MPKTTFDPDNKLTQPWDFPKLHLKYDARERINVIQKEIDFEFTHEVKAPLIQNGEPIIELAERKDGSTYERKKMEFLGRILCLGRADVMEAKAKDPDVCPLCRVASNSDALAMPQRRFGAHVLVYNTVETNFDLITPFSARLVVWLLGERTYNTVSEAAAEWAEVDPNTGEKIYADVLRKHDLLLGPCKSEDFQNYDIRVAREAAWLMSPEAQAFVSALWKDPNNHAPDMAALIGKRRDVAGMEQMANLVLERNRQADGMPSMVSVPGGNGGAQSIEGILGSVDAAPAAVPQSVPQPVPAGVPDLDAAPAVPQAAPVPQPVPQAAPQPPTDPQPQAAPAPSAQPEQTAPAPVSGGTPSFDELLGQLDDSGN